MGGCVGCCLGVFDEAKGVRNHNRFVFEIPSLFSSSSDC